MDRTQVLDTNILLRGKREKGIVTYPVLCELDRLKTYSEEVGKLARDAIYNIYKNQDTLILDSQQKDDGEAVDDYLIRYAKEHNAILKTLDLSLYLKAISQGVEVLFDEYNYSNEYTGATYFNQLSEEDAASIFGGGQLDPIKFPNNHFILSKTAVYRVVNGYPKLVETEEFSSVYTGKVKPLNPEQRCAINLLRDRTVTVVSISGSYGTGE